MGFERSHRVFLAGAVALTALLAAPVGAMDPRYTDADGNLTADPPADPKDWLDPNVLIFAYTPVEDPAVYAKVWEGFLKHMEEKTGKQVQFFPVQSNAPRPPRARACTPPHGDDLPGICPGRATHRDGEPAFGTARRHVLLEPFDSPVSTCGYRECLSSLGSHRSDGACGQACRCALGRSAPACRDRSGVGPRVHDAHRRPARRGDRL